jgi:hypothetical protein
VPKFTSSSFTAFPASFDDITSWCKVILEKTVLLQSEKKFPAFYETGKSTIGAFPEPNESGQQPRLYF